MESETQKYIEAFYNAKLQTEAEATRISLPSGGIVLCESGSLDASYRLNKSVPPGTYNVDVYRLPEDVLQDYEDAPTVGIDGIVINFSDSEIAGWEQVENSDGESPVDSGNLIDFVVIDEESVEDAEDEVSSTLEDCYTEGFETCADGNALVVYVGESALDHDFYWAVDGDGSPVKLVGIFRYPS